MMVAPCKRIARDVSIATKLGPVRPVQASDAHAGSTAFRIRASI